MASRVRARWVAGGSGSGQSGSLVRAASIASTCDRAWHDSAGERAGDPRQVAAGEAGTVRDHDHGPDHGHGGGPGDTADQDYAEAAAATHPQQEQRVSREQ